jgi:hypothetical protein
MYHITGAGTFLAQMDVQTNDLMLPRLYVKQVRAVQYALSPILSKSLDVHNDTTTDWNQSFIDMNLIS